MRLSLHGRLQQLINPVEGERVSSKLFIRPGHQEHLVIRELLADHFDEAASRDLLRRVIKFEVEHGATMIIPPYPYVSSPSDPWFGVALQWLRLTRRVMIELDVHLPVCVVFCAQLRGVCSPARWAD